LFRSPKGPLTLFYKVGPSPSQWWGMTTTSTDGGKSWGTPRRLAEGVLGPIKNKPVVLPDGGWIAGSSTEGSGGWQVHFEVSRDEGQTWRIIGPIGKGAGLNAIQPSILSYPD